MGFRERRVDEENEHHAIIDIWTEPFPVDISDRGEEFVLAAVVLGLDRDRIDVSITPRSVVITADYGENDSRAPLQREITLLEPVEQSAVSTTYSDGILELRLPKRDREQ